MHFRRAGVETAEGIHLAHGFVYGHVKTWEESGKGY